MKATPARRQSGQRVYYFTSLHKRVLERSRGLGLQLLSRNSFVHLRESFFESVVFDMQQVADYFYSLPQHSPRRRLPSAPPSPCAG